MFCYNVFLRHCYKPEGWAMRQSGDMKKWEREWIIWTSRASPQELMYTICLPALIYAPSLQCWSISRSTARHVCMAPRSKSYACAPFPWKPYENVRTCYVTSHWWDESLPQLDLLKSELKLMNHMLNVWISWQRCLEITLFSVTALYCEKKKVSGKSVKYIGNDA